MEEKFKLNQILIKDQFKKILIGDYYKIGQHAAKHVEEEVKQDKKFVFQELIKNLVKDNQLRTEYVMLKLVYL